jgi:23S rRNA (pseudouridine1915-N3)-methyltransferase
MKIHLVAIGQRMPTWVNQAFNEYAKRLPNDYQLILRALSAQKRTKSSNTEQLIATESLALISACPAQSHRIALDRVGRSMNTHDIAKKLNQWHDQSQDIAILIGGPEGISKTHLEQCHSTWSLSDLTLPHPLVRILIAEQIYRAWSILSNHPYHR